MMQIPEMNIEQHQIALLSKLKMGYDLCVKNPTITCNPIYFFNTSKEEQEKFLLYDTKSESYRMLVVNICEGCFLYSLEMTFFFLYSVIPLADACFPSDFRRL